MRLLFAPDRGLGIPMILFVMPLLMFLQGATPSSDPLPIGERAAPFTLPDVMDGRSISLEEVTREHKLTVVLWIGIDCPYSNACNEDYERLFRAYKDRGVAFLGINSNEGEGPSLMKAHAEEAGFTFPMLRDERNVVADAFGAGFTPELWVLDGQMKAVFHGGLIWRGNDKSLQQDFTAALDALLEGRSPPKATTYAFGCSIKRVM